MSQKKARKKVSLITDETRTKRDEAEVERNNAENRRFKREENAWKKRARQARAASLHNAFLEIDIGYKI